MFCEKLYWYLYLFENISLFTWKRCMDGSEWNRLNFRGRLFVHFSDRWSTHNRLFYSAVRQYITKHFPGWSICQSRKNNGIPTFRTYQKHSLPVNMAVDINKPKICDKSLNLSKESVGNWLKYKKIRGY